MHAASPAKLLTVPQVAARYNVHRVTVWRWIRKGIIGVVHVGPYRRTRITEAEADRHFTETPGAKS
jgi:excisionase family DNA binding protein